MSPCMQLLITCGPESGASITVQARLVAFRLSASLSNHLRQPLVEEIVQLCLSQPAKSHQFKTEYFPRTEAIGVG